MEKETVPITLNEPLLPDDYPVFPTYYYVADGKVIRSPIGGDVRRLKAESGAKEIRRCDMAERGLL